MAAFSILIFSAALIWLAVLLAPWRPWRNGDVLEAIPCKTEAFDDITVLIPARNEADVITETLNALASQCGNLRVIVVDDQSTDGTHDIASQVHNLYVSVVQGRPLPAGWSGKLWALEQGRSLITTDYTLIIDADIRLEPGIVAMVRERMQSLGLDFLSLMAAPRMTTFWEKLLMPAFVYFFKLIYPFRLAGSPGRGIAAAAGGFIMLKTRVLEDIGGYGVLRDALIDDCELARKVKARGYKTWIGLTHSVHSLRRSGRLNQIWQMVARTAFTQLRSSTTLLLLCTALMFTVYLMPLVGLIHPLPMVRLFAGLACVGMIVSYLPTLWFYGRSPAWALALPIIAILYLAMTWYSAWQHWHSEGARWKGRTYSARTA